MNCNKVYKIRTKKQFSDLSKLIISDGYKITTNQLQVHCQHDCGCLLIDDVIKHRNWIQPCENHHNEVDKILKKEME